MKKLIITAGAALAIAIPALAPTGAQASPILECGALADDGVSNITTRNVTCSDARSFANKFSYLSHWYTGSVTLPGWHPYWAEVHYNGWRQDDVRATRTYHVIHFQIGPFGVSDGSLPAGGIGMCRGIPAGQPCY